MPQPAAQHIGTLEDGRHVLRIACDAKPVEADGAQWIQCCPMGPIVLARDGRSFIVSDISKVVASSRVPCLVDWEHESEMWRGSSEAAGWIEEWTIEPAASGGRFPRAGIWGRVDWTPDGGKDVQDKAYRFLSPVVLLDPETRDALEIASVALTNCPALEMEGLQSFRERLSARFGQVKANEVKIMKPETIALLLSALGLQAGATDEQILESARAGQSARSAGNADKEMRLTLSGQVTTLNTQLSTSQARVAELEGQIEKVNKEAEAAAFAREVDACLDAASAEGRLTPSMRKGFKASCANRAAFDSFKNDVLPSLPKLCEPAPRSSVKQPNTSNANTETCGLDRDVYSRLKSRSRSDDEIKEAVEYNRAAATRDEDGED